MTSSRQAGQHKMVVYLAAGGKGKPHEDLANFGDDAFTKHWGRLCVSNPVFDSPGIWQDKLREAWRGDLAAIEEIRKWVNAYMTTSLTFVKGRIEMAPKDFLGTIFLLFLRDRAAGKTAICENPDCVSPYFIKAKKTQKLCGSAACNAFAQRNYALNWWHKEGKKQREEKRAKAQNRRRKAS